MADPQLQDLRQALRAVVDPETGHDLIAMGMIYDLRLDRDRAIVTMTTTTPGCPLAGFLRMGVETALRAIPGIREVAVTLTWDPPWSPDRMEPPRPQP